jgi:hypothetical protein
MQEHGDRCAPFPRTAVRADSSADDARGVETVIVGERGQWAVDIVVVFADGVVRKRITTYRTRGRAELAASLIKRAAERDRRSPTA